MPNLSGFHHVALTVSNCDASTEWYRSTMGMEEVFREEAEHRRACVMSFPGHPYGIGLVEHVGHDLAVFDPRRQGLDHVAFAVADRAELDRWAEHLDELGVENSGVIEVPIGAILNFKDPDRIALSLFWDS
ncbi:MAG TPA: VOC family protein [Ilumatobacteraceae bacterium]|jgi:catechol 2,3-dioxygenase-like lactoylglutathione lyase family enzyme